MFIVQDTSRVLNGMVYFMQILGYQIETERAAHLSHKFINRVTRMEGNIF